jgi:ligand-binding sensor domain-containing protein
LQNEIAGKTFTNYTNQDGLAIDAILCIYKDKNGKLWFGTEGACVYTFNGKTFEKFKN